MSRVNQLSITAHIFDNTGSVYLRTEDVIIPLPALFVPCNSPRADIDIKTKIVYGHESGFVEEIYVEENLEEIDALINAAGDEAYLPTDFPNLEYWYDASQIEGLADGAEIVTLADLSGNGNTLTPLSALRRPTLETNELNGLPVFRFSSGDDLVGTKAGFDFLHQGDSTIFWLLKPTDNSSTKYIFDSDNGSLLNVGRHVRYLTSGNFNDSVSADGSVGGDDVFDFTTTGGQFVINQWTLIVTRYEQGKTGDDAECFINDDVVLTDQGPKTPSGLTSTNTPTFFSLASGSQGYIGDVATFFGYSRALTNDEINKIVGGLPFGS